MRMQVCEDFPDPFTEIRGRVLHSCQMPDNHVVGCPDLGFVPHEHLRFKPYYGALQVVKEGTRGLLNSRPVESFCRQVQVPQNWWIGLLHQDLAYGTAVPAL